MIEFVDIVYLSETFPLELAAEYFLVRAINFLVRAIKNAYYYRFT